MFTIDHDPLNRRFADINKAINAAFDLAEIVRAEVEVLDLEGCSEATVEPVFDGTPATWPLDASCHGREWWRG